MKLTPKNLIERIKNSKSTGSLNRSVINNNKLLKIILNETIFLDENVSLTERILNIKNGFKEIQKCDCGRKLSWNKKRYYNKTCGNDKCILKLKCVDLTDEQKREKNRKADKTRLERYGDEKYVNVEKIKQTNLERYGETSYTKTDEYKKMMIETHGYISPFELKETHEKTKKTLKKRYGVEHNFDIKGMREKIKQTWINNFGEDHPMKHQPFIDKLIETNIERYGERCAIMNENKNKYSYKEYNINGFVYYLQGYEDYVLDKLLMNHKKSNIAISIKEIANEIGTIFYIQNGKEHKYYPDLFLKKENLVIEVKSEYTYNKELVKNKLKEKACLDAGLNFQFLLIDNNVYNKWKRKKNNK